MVKRAFNKQLPLRYFKSHLLIFPRLTRDNYFYIDGGATGFMNHGNGSVAGLNRDSIAIESPEYTPHPDKVNQLRCAVQRILPHADLELKSKPVACVKPDLALVHEQPDLGDEIYPISENYLVAFPGKMAQAPCLAERLVNTIELEPSSYRSRSIRDLELTGETIEVHLRPVDYWMATSC